jgi:hypothetical protein
MLKLLDKSDRFIAPCQTFSFDPHTLPDCQIAIATLEILGRDIGKYMLLDRFTSIQEILMLSAVVFQ